MSIDCALILEQLLPGKRNIQSSHQLSRKTGVPRKNVGFKVKELRRDGHLVGSVHGSGYFMIETQEEFDETRDHLLARALSGMRNVEEFVRAWEARDAR